MTVLDTTDDAVYPTLFFVTTGAPPTTFYRESHYVTAKNCIA
jgi:hypothetical protein